MGNFVPGERIWLPTPHCSTSSYRLIPAELTKPEGRSSKTAPCAGPTLMGLATPRGLGAPAAGHPVLCKPPRASATTATAGGQAPCGGLSAPARGLRRRFCGARGWQRAGYPCCAAQHGLPPGWTAVCGTSRRGPVRAMRVPGEDGRMRLGGCGAATVVLLRAPGTPSHRSFVGLPLQIRWTLGAGGARRAGDAGEVKGAGRGKGPGKQEGVGAT